MYASNCASIDLIVTSEQNVVLTPYVTSLMSDSDISVTRGPYVPRDVAMAAMNTITTIQVQSIAYLRFGDWPYPDVHERSHIARQIDEEESRVQVRRLHTGYSSYKLAKGRGYQAWI